MGVYPDKQPKTESEKELLMLIRDMVMTLKDLGLPYHATQVVDRARHFLAMKGELA